MTVRLWSMNLPAMKLIRRYVQVLGVRIRPCGELRRALPRPLMLMLPCPELLGCRV